MKPLILSVIPLLLLANTACYKKSGLPPVATVAPETDSYCQSETLTWLDAKGNSCRQLVPPAKSGRIIDLVDSLPPQLGTARARCHGNEWFLENNLNLCVESESHEKTVEFAVINNDNSDWPAAAKTQRRLSIVYDASLISGQAEENVKISRAHFLAPIETEAASSKVKGSSAEVFISANLSDIEGAMVFKYGFFSHFDYFSAYINLPADQHRNNDEQPKSSGSIGLFVIDSDHHLTIDWETSLSDGPKTFEKPIKAFVDLRNEA